MIDLRHIPVEEKDVQCCFDHGIHAIAIYHFEEGCACLPDVKEQPLCIGHATTTEPLGDMELMMIVDRERYRLFLQCEFKDPVVILQGEQIPESIRRSTA